jgi:hypothetical protein
MRRIEPCKFTPVKEVKEIKEVKEVKENKLGFTSVLSMPLVNVNMTAHESTEPE